MKLRDIGAFVDGLIERFVGDDRARLDFIDAHTSAVFPCNVWHYHDEHHALVECSSVREAIDNAMRLKKEQAI